MTASTPEQPDPRGRAAMMRRWVVPVILFGLLLAIFAHHHEHYLERIKAADEAAIKAVESVSIVELFGDIRQRITNCDYRNLVICEPICVPGIPCTLREHVPSFDNSKRRNGLEIIGGFVFEGFTQLLRLPDAASYATRKRYHEGAVPFAMMLLFLAINAVVLGFVLWGCIATWNEGGPEFWKVWWVRMVGVAVFGIAVLVVPLLVSLMFWLIQLLIVAMMHTFGLFLQALIAIAALPGLVAAAAIHHAHLMFHAGKKIGKDG